MNKRGRPRSESAKDGQYRLRINDEETSMLEEISARTGKSKADILRTSLKIYYGMTVNLE